MYILNQGKCAVPSIGENVISRNLAKTVHKSTIITSTSAQNTSKQSTTLVPILRYKMFLSGLSFENTLAALLEFSSFRKRSLPALTQIRSFVQSSKQNQMKNQDKDGSPKPLPKLLYIQNPVVWFSNKMDFRHLRISIDPSFTEKEFTRGARQAVSTVTQMLSTSMFDSMKPLFTKNALLTLRRDVEILWSDEVRRNIALNPQDIQLIIPRKLHFRNMNDKKFCDIDVVFIGLKHVDSNKKDQSSLLFVDIISRFHRNYTDGAAPEWTIAAFKVRKFNVMPMRS